MSRMRKGMAAAAGAGLAAAGLYLWTKRAERHAHWTPAEALCSLLPVLEREKLSPADYAFLLHETGLGRPAVDALREKRDWGTFARIQGAFHAPVQVKRRKFGPVSWTERLADEHGRTRAGVILAPLEDGDVLISASSHTFGWRNGHAGLVVDAAEGQTLESVVIGQDACVCSAGKWREYPAMMVLRLKDASREKRAAIASNARKRLEGAPYRLTAGLFSPGSADGTVPCTQCAHLVREAFRPFGYDLDPRPVATPRGIANSPLLELVQVYGLDPEKLWR